MLYQLCGLHSFHGNQSQADYVVFPFPFSLYTDRHTVRKLAVNASVFKDFITAMLTLSTCGSKSEEMTVEFSQPLASWQSHFSVTTQTVSIALEFVSFPGN